MFCEHSIIVGVYRGCLVTISVIISRGQLTILQGIINTNKRGNMNLIIYATL